MLPRTAVAFAVSFVFAVGAESADLITGSLATPDGIVGVGRWEPEPAGHGVRVEWQIGQNSDGSWHYAYSFYQQEDPNVPLDKLASHFILQVSENLTESDLFNLSGDLEGHDAYEIRVFDGTQPSNPGMPSAMYGLKIEFGGEQTHVAFDTLRQPQWSDFYAKSGKNPVTYGYNVDYGVPVANEHDFLGTPVDADGNVLHKVLAPDTTPEPGSLLLLAVGTAATLLRKRRTA
jgi:hypothetical protein